MTVRNRLAVSGWLAFFVFVMGTAPADAQEAIPASTRPQERGPITVLAVVGDFATGAPVVGAFVRIDGELAGITDDNGRFQVRLAPGLHRMDVRRVGYEGKTIEFPLDTTTLVQLSVALDPIVYDLPAIVVEADRTKLVFGKMREFYRRMEIGNGHYFTRQEIERRAPRAISDLLRMVPGVEVNQVGIAPAEVRMRTATEACAQPMLLLDGIAIDASSPDVVADPEQVEAVEVYTRSLNVPVEFSRQGSICGVIAVWSR